MKVSKTFRICPEILKKLNVHCQKEERTFTWVIEKALAAYLDKGSVVVSKKEIAKPKSKRFIKPELNEVSAYFYERGSKACNDDAQSFIDFYESKGWVVGKSSMKCWKAAIRNWMKKSVSPPSQYKTAQEKRAERNGEIFDYEKATTF